MTHPLHDTVQGSPSTADVLTWWQTLPGDEQDLLRVTNSLLPFEPYLLALLASTGCPLVTVDAGGLADPRDPSDAGPSYTLHDPQQLQAVLTQL